MILPTKTVSTTSQTRLPSPPLRQHTGARQRKVGRQTIRIDAPSKREAREPATPVLSNPAGLSLQEVRRRLWHFLPGVLAFAATLVPHLDPVRLPAMVAAVLLAILIPGYFAIRFHRSYTRSDSESWAPALVGYVLPLSVLFLAFRGHLEIGLAVACIIAFGDGCATLMGMAFGRRKLPWNRKKSWVGLVSFVLGASTMGTLIYWLEATPVIPVAMVAMVIVPAAMACALLESIPSRWNDNITVGVSASVLVVTMQTVVIGWM